MSFFLARIKETSKMEAEMGPIVFGHAVTFHFVGRSLVVTQPYDLLSMLLWSLPGALILLVVVIYLAVKGRYFAVTDRSVSRLALCRRALGSIFVITILFDAITSFLLGSFTLTLDPDHGTATVDSFYFWHNHTDTYPLDAVSGAMVETSRGSSAINLVVGEGHHITLSVYNDQPGKYEAVYQINRFLGREQQ